MFNNSPKIRQTLYAVSIAASIAAVFVSLINENLGNAFTITAGILATTAGTTALSNITQKN